MLQIRISPIAAFLMLLVIAPFVLAQPPGGSDYFREKGEPGIKTYGIWDMPFANPPKTPFGLYVNSGLGDITISEENLKAIAKLDNLVSLSLLRTDVSDERLKHLASLKNLRWLDLAKSQVTDKGLKELASLKNLTTLNLDGAKVTASGLKELAPLQNLTTLKLDGNQATPAGLRELAPLKRLAWLQLPSVDDASLQALREVGLLHALAKAPSPQKAIKLYVKGSGVSGAGLRELAILENLETLVLEDLTVTPAELKELAALKNLCSLDLSHARFPGAGLQELTGLEKLTTLDLSSSRIDDAGLKEMAGFKNLTSLTLTDTKMADAGLRELAVHKELMTLFVHGTKVTGAEVKAFAGMKGLTTLYFDEDKITDATMCGLREIGLLHSLWQARATGEKRPKSAAHVVAFTMPPRGGDHGLQELFAFPNLASLCVVDCKVTADGMKDVARFRNLTTLYVNQAQATPAGIKELAPLKNVNFIQIGHHGHPQVTDASLRALRDVGLMHALSLAEGKAKSRPKSPDEVVTVNLRSSKLTPKAFQDLNAFKNLVVLDLGHTDIPLKAWKKLDRLHDLTSLNLDGPKVTDADLKELTFLVRQTAVIIAGRYTCDG